jgi:hypothetical protein
MRHARSCWSPGAEGKRLADKPPAWQARRSGRMESGLANRIEASLRGRDVEAGGGEEAMSGGLIAGGIALLLWLLFRLVARIFSDNGNRRVP